jgi:hypothetical protein
MLAGFAARIKTTVKTIMLNLPIHEVVLSAP